MKPSVFFSRELHILLKILNFFAITTMGRYTFRSFFVALVVLIGGVIHPGLHLKTLLLLLNYISISYAVIYLSYITAFTLKIVAISLTLILQKNNFCMLWNNVLNFNEIALKLNLQHIARLRLNLLLILLKFLLITSARFTKIHLFKTTTFLNVLNVVMENIATLYEELLKLKYVMFLSLFTNYLKQFNDLLLADIDSSFRNDENLMVLLKNIAREHQNVMELVYKTNCVMSPLILTIFFCELHNFIIFAFFVIDQIFFGQLVQNVTFLIVNILNPLLNILLVMIPVRNCTHEVSD